MSARNESRGRRRNRRTSHEEHENNDAADRDKAGHRSRRRDHRETTVATQQQQRPRSSSSPDKRRRKRPNSSTTRKRTRSYDNHDGDDGHYNYHHDYEKESGHRYHRDRRRQERPRRYKSRKRSRQRRSPSSSVSSVGSQHSDHHRRRYRRRRRGTRRRSRSGEWDRPPPREYSYYNHDHEDRGHHRQHQPHDANNNGGPRYPPRAGVVSDDDDGYQHSQTHLHLQPSVVDTNDRNKTGAETGTATVGNPELHEQGHQPSNTSTTKNNNSSTNVDKDSKKQDDTIGHFQGRDGCVIADRYRILKEVGVGTFGRVVECLDIKRRRGRQGRENDDRYYRRRENHHHHHHQYSYPHSCYRSSQHLETSERENNPNNIVAIKIVRNVKRYYDSAKIEAEIIDDVNLRGERGVTHCAIMYDTFSFQGHYCMVFECLGPSLYDFLKGQKYHPFPIHCVRDFAKQLLETLEFLHSFRLIHTDLKPENILLLNGRQIPQRGGYSIPESTRIKVIDFGGATYDNEKKSSIVNTRQYRAPEVILGCGWSMPSDLWSIGCILAELYQGELLFATHDNIEHLALIERVIGPFPRKMLKRAKNVEIVDKAFDSNGSHRMEQVLPPDHLTYVKRIVPLESIIIYTEDLWFLRLLRRILVIDPDERATARKCLRKF